MRYITLLIMFVIIAGSWYAELQPRVYACSEVGNPPDVVKQCKDITRWQSWIKK